MMMMMMMMMMTMMTRMLMRGEACQCHFKPVAIKLVTQRLGTSHLPSLETPSTIASTCSNSPCRKRSPAKVGHPQTCVYPDVCLGIAHVSGKAPSPGTGGLADTQCICPFRPKESVGEKGRYIVYLADPCPERGTWPDTWANPKHTSGSTQVWGCPKKEFFGKKVTKKSDRSIRKSDQKVTERDPKTKKNQRRAWWSPEPIKPSNLKTTKTVMKATPLKSGFFKALFLPRVGRAIACGHGCGNGGGVGVHVGVCQEGKNSLNLKFLGGDIPGTSGTQASGYPGQKLYASGLFSVVLDREWLGCPGIWVRTFRMWKNFMQENIGLIFRTLVWGGFCCSAPQYGRGRGGSGGDTHTHTHTHTPTRTHTHTHTGTHTHTQRSVHANVAPSAL